MVNAKQVLGTDEIELPSGHMVMATAGPSGIEFCASDPMGDPVTDPAKVEILATVAFGDRSGQFEIVLRHGKVLIPSEVLEG